MARMAWVECWPVRPSRLVSRRAQPRETTRTGFHLVENMDDITKAKAILLRLEAELKNVSAELAIHKTAAFYVDGVGRVLLSVVSR